MLPLTTTVLVVDDGLKDCTADIVQRIIKKVDADAKMVLHEVNRGYGAAVRTGMQFAIDNGYTMHFLWIGDLTNHPKHLTLFYEKFR